VAKENRFTLHNYKVNLQFKLESGQMPQSMNPKNARLAQVAFDLPDAAKTGDWSVRMLVGSDEKGKQRS
jgi:hypothetical protein